MVKQYLVAMSVVVLSLTVRAAPADQDDCNDAIDSYNSALSDVGDALDQYTKCLSESQAQDDCSSEFVSLKNAQDDFENAVAEYQADCD